MDSLFHDGRQLQPWWCGRPWRFWLMVLSPLLVMGGCGLFWLKAKETALLAEREAAVFHQRLEAGQYAAIYDAAAPAFRARVSGRFCQILRRSARQDGSMQDASQSAELLYQCQHLRHGRAASVSVGMRERILERNLVFAVAGDGSQLLGYQRE